jgi:hypothetical protein
MSFSEITYQSAEIRIEKQSAIPATLVFSNLIPTTANDK